MDDPDSPEFILPEYNIEEKPVNLSYPLKNKGKKNDKIISAIKNDRRCKLFEYFHESI